MISIGSVPQVAWYLIYGAGATLMLSAASIALSAIAGLALAALHLHSWWPLRAVALLYSFIVRGVPLLVLLVTIYFSLPYMHFDLPAPIAATLVIAAYFAAYMGEVFRAAIQAVPRTQWDAGRSVGMRRLALLQIVILPQAARLMVAPFINTSLGIVKNTSLVSAIGVWELTTSGREIVERTGAAFEVYIAVAGLYFLVCFALSLASRGVEREFTYVH